MSKLGKLGRFFRQVGHFAPLILMATPLAPIAPAIVAAIQEAESIHGDQKGVEKLAHVIAIAKDAAEAANAQAGHVVLAPEVIDSVASQVVSAVVTVVNAVDNPGGK